MSGAYNISNVKNFYSTFDKKNINDIKEKYSLLVSEFLLCAIESFPLCTGTAEWMTCARHNTASMLICFNRDQQFDSKQY